jgi:hypothetical protein
MTSSEGWNLVGAKPLLLIHQSIAPPGAGAHVYTPRKLPPNARFAGPGRLSGRQPTGLGETPGISERSSQGITTEQVVAEKQPRLSESKFATIFIPAPMPS